MSWFFETKIRESKISGTITAKRRFGSWAVYVDGSEQSGPQTRALWTKVYQKLKDSLGSNTVRRALMLGLGGGGDIKILSQNFPHIQLTAIEHDAEMIALTKELALWGPFTGLNVLCGDAAKVVPSLKETYDLIIVDLFHGQTPSPLANNQAFLDALNIKLEKNGFLAANVFGKPEYLELFKENFTLVSTWRFGLNHIAIFQKATAQATFPETE
jgi:spermidine synthase